MHPPDAAIRLLCLPLSGAASLPALPERPLPATPAVGALSSEHVSVPAGSDPAGRIGWQFKRTRHKKAEAIQKRGKRFTKDLSLRAVLYLVLLTDNCQPIRPAGSDPAGTLTEMEQAINNFLQLLEKQEKKGFKELATLQSLLTQLRKPAQGPLAPYLWSRLWRLVSPSTGRRSGRNVHPMGIAPVLTRSGPQVTKQRYPGLSQFIW